MPSAPDQLTIRSVTTALPTRHSTISKTFPLVTKHSYLVGTKPENSNEYCLIDGLERILHSPSTY